MCVSDMSECVSVGMCVYVCVVCVCVSGVSEYVSVCGWVHMCVRVCVVATLTHIMSFKIHILCIQYNQCVHALTCI